VVQLLQDPLLALILEVEPDLEVTPQYLQRILLLPDMFVWGVEHHVGQIDVVRKAEPAHHAVR